MNVKRIPSLIAPSLVAMFTLAGMAAPAFAQEYGQDRYGQDRYGPADDFDYAPVVRVEPLVRTIHVSVPRQECYTETRYVPVRGRDAPAAGSMIVGGLIGAVIGHQFDGHRSRNVGSVAGAVIGSAIGHDAAQRRDTGYDEREVRAVDAQRCEVRSEDRVEQRTEGYRVTYRYHGRLYTTQMPRDPGERVQVRVNVEPVG